MCDGSIPIFPSADRPRVARRSLRRVRQSIDVRRREARGTGTAGCSEPRCANSASVVRCRSSTACGSSSRAAWRTGNCWQARGRRRSRRRRPDAGRYRDWKALRLGRFAGRIKRGLFGGVGRTGIREADLDGLGGGPVEMPERQPKLDRERKQRQPRAVLEVFPEPIQELAPSPNGQDAFEAALAAQCYIITSEGNNEVNRVSRAPRNCGALCDCCNGRM